VRLLLWHGWVLEGSGSNVYTSRTAEVFRRQGHLVLLVCQEPHPERYGWIDAWGTCGQEGVSPLTPSGVEPATGSVTVLRPDIGPLLPVFVYDDYEGFEVKRFVDLTGAELDAYLGSNVAALRTASAWFDPDAVVAGHVVPGAVIASRALGEGRYAAKVHGSDLEYAIKVQDRYADLAREGLEGARMVTGATADVLRRAVEVVPGAADRTRVVTPGVDVQRFHPMPRREALEEAARRLDRDPDTARGRPPEIERLVEAALGSDSEEIDRLATDYDQPVPDQGVAAELRALAASPASIVGYFGKLIPQKGVDVLLQALAMQPGNVRGLVVGFGLHREWLTALTLALGRGNPEDVAWIRDRSQMALELTPDEVRAAAGLSGRVTFTGRLDHRYAPNALAALDVLVVPSILDEAFGMVAAEGAAAGALPLVARHSGLAEVAGALEGEVGRPGFFSYQSGPGAVHRLADGIRTLLSIPAEERAELRTAVSAFVAREWTWERTAARLLEAAS
jgi:glycosyltransferase involved in cell wall biosynthesis